MKLLVIGGGGREHAIAWKVAQNPLVEKVYCAPGNGGTSEENKCQNVNLDSIEELLAFAKKENIDLTVVGPEAKLIEGIVDVFKANGLNIFGPSKAAAMLEGSKAFAKEFMKKYGVKTAEYMVFEKPEDAVSYLSNCSFPIVLKADGLAAGKGVVICNKYDEAVDVIKKFMIEDIFAGSGKRIVIEEFLEGVEASILSVTDGKTIIPFLSSKDHKCIFDGDKGPNTGGMGAIAPNPYCTKDVLQDFNINILLPTLKGFTDEKMDYSGIVFFGVMITKKGCYLLEYNVRFGDPETQAVLPLMKTDLVDLLNRAVNKDLENYCIEWKQESSCCVVASAGGYPGAFKKGDKITIGTTKGKVFLAGAQKVDNAIYTSGGRVFCIVNVSDKLSDAISLSYEDLNKVSFEGIYFRKDIGTLRY